MFDKLQERFESTFKKVRGYGKLTESNIKDTLREVRVALLEADVNFKVTKDFLEKVKELSDITEKNFVFTVSADDEELPEKIFDFCQKL